MVTLAGDKGEDVVHLLRAVFEREYVILCIFIAPELSLESLQLSFQSYYHRDDENTPLEVIVALLLLSTKYDFNTVRKDVILHISRQYPMNLQEYEALDKEETPLFGKTRADCHFPLLVAAVTADADVLLPCLFFACSDYPTGPIFRQTQSLPREALQILIEGKEDVDSEINTFICSIPEQLRKTSAKIGCPYGAPCLEKAKFKDLHLHIQPYFRDFTGKDIALNCLSSASVCGRCLEFAVKMIDEERQDLWDVLPCYYKFPEWSVLQAQLKAIAES